MVPVLGAKDCPVALKPSLRAADVDLSLQELVPGPRELVTRGE